MIDDLSEQLRNLKADLPPPRTNLTKQEKLKLIARLGPRTVQALLKAKRELPMRRIPFLFSSLDAQDVVDVLANEFDDVSFHHL